MNSILQPREVQVNVFTATAAYPASGIAIAELTGVPVGLGAGIVDGEAMAARWPCDWPHHTEKGRRF